MVSLPNTIKALQIQSDRTVKVVEIPFASQELVKNLPEDQIIVSIFSFLLEVSIIFVLLIRFVCV